MQSGSTLPIAIRSAVLHVALLATAALLSAGAAQAQTVARTPLASNHPLIGKWKLEIPNSACDGLFEVRADGTTRATSAEQVIESDVDLAPKPSENGYYKIAEKVTTENGKANCVGRKITIGQSGTNFVILNRDGDEFLLCAKEDINTCVGPFARQKTN